MIKAILSVLSTVLGFYSLAIFVRILLSWFSGSSFGKPYNILCSITDPYLNWFSRFPVLRAGRVDLSPVVALAVLSIVNSAVSTIAQHGIITIGLLLYLCLSVLWSAVSFILGFFIIILALRFIAYLLRVNVYTYFWQIVEQISKPIMFRIERIMFRNRIIRFSTCLIISIFTLLILTIALGGAVRFVGNLLLKLPI
ncbi:membrane protein [Spirochaetia bacterium]|nr:membrane protein [Spirochaetia bacterium]